MYKVAEALPTTTTRNRSYKCLICSFALYVPMTFRIRMILAKLSFSTFLFPKHAHHLVYCSRNIFWVIFLIVNTNCSWFLPPNFFFNFLFFFLSLRETLMVLRPHFHAYGEIVYYSKGKSLTSIMEY